MEWIAAWLPVASPHSAAVDAWAPPLSCSALDEPPFDSMPRWPESPHTKLSFELSLHSHDDDVCRRSELAGWVSVSPFWWALPLRACGGDAAAALPPEDVDDACAPPLSCWALESPVSLATLTGAFAFTGAFTAVDGEALTEPTCTVTMECFAVWEPVSEQPQDVDDACAPPVSCWALESPVSLATLTGAFAVTGVLTAVDGEALIDPTCTVPTDPTAVWLPEPAPSLAAALPASASASRLTPNAQRRFIVFPPLLYEMPGLAISEAG